MSGKISPDSPTRSTARVRAVRETSPATERRLTLIIDGLVREVFSPGSPMSGTPLPSRLIRSIGFVREICPGKAPLNFSTRSTVCPGYPALVSWSVRENCPGNLSEETTIISAVHVRENIPDSPTRSTALVRAVRETSPATERRLTLIIDGLVREVFSPGSPMSGTPLPSRLIRSIGFVREICPGKAPLNFSTRSTGCPGYPALVSWSVRENCPGNLSEETTIISAVHVRENFP